MDVAKIIILIIIGIIGYSSLLDNFVFIIKNYLKYIPFIGPNGFILLINVLFFTIIYYITLFGRKDLKSLISVTINSIIPIFYGLIIVLNVLFLLTKVFGGYKNPSTLNYIFILIMIGLLVYEYFMKYTKPEKFSADGWVLPTIKEEEKDYNLIENNDNISQIKEISNFTFEDEEENIKEDIEEEIKEDIEEIEEDEEEDIEEDEIGWRGNLMFSDKIFIEDILIKKLSK